jgi:beta-galactosidase GanA
MNSFRFVLALYFVFATEAYGQTEHNPSNEESQISPSQIPHLQRHGAAARLFVEGKPFLLISGELHNSTAGGFEYMRPVWKRLAKKNLNSVIATVSWELVEPVEGKFDFALVDSVIAGARAANLKLVLIWFASWKNASSVYIPSWVKKDYQKYPRARDEHGKPLEILSTFGKASCEADARAFAALMRHIKEVDGKQQTVVMMQIENEVGVLDNLGTTPGNARRDFSDPANAAYDSPVPKELMEYLGKHKESLFPELRKVWAANGFKTSGSWEEVFGKSEFKPKKKDWQFYSYYTEEVFSAWHYARYIEQVVAAGKKEYPLPMFVNAWLKQPFSYWPGRYPSGGPLPQVLDVWRAGAPSIDFIAPDIYMDEFVWACREYTRSGNPLFIPETRGGELGAARAFYAFGEHNAGCFAPFGIDNPRYAENDPLDESYAALQRMSAIILEHQGQGTMRGILVDTVSSISKLELGDYLIEARLAERRKPTVAGGLIIQLGPQEFIVAGKALDVFFIPKDTSMRVAVDTVDEGTFENGKWIPKRRLNGDEVHASTWSGTGVILPSHQISIQKISLYRYK